MRPWREWPEGKTFRNARGLLDGLVCRARPVDVTTLRTTPNRAMAASPSSTVVRVNGGVLRIYPSWRSVSDGIPNRWLSASRHVGSSSIIRKGWHTRWSGLPPPRAQESVRGKARSPSRASAGMGRLTEADGERRRAGTSPARILHRPLDKRILIDGTVWPEGTGRGS